MAETACANDQERMQAMESISVMTKIGREVRDLFKAYGSTQRSESNSEEEEVQMRDRQGQSQGVLLWRRSLGRHVLMGRRSSGEHVCCGAGFWRACIVLAVKIAEPMSLVSRSGRRETRWTKGNE